MKPILIFCFMFMGIIGLNGQVNQVVEITANDDVKEVVKKDIQYAFDEFTDGLVKVKSGATNSGKLNYNYLLGEMQFLDPATNDILALADPSIVAIVTINNREFVPVGNGTEFMELVNKGAASLGVQRIVKVLPIGKKGAYGLTNTTSSVTSVTLAGGGADNQRKSLEITEDMRVSTEIKYYLYSNNEVILIKGAKTYTKAYPKDKAVLIEKYITDNKINLKKEEDLIKLTEYCNQL